VVTSYFGRRVSFALAIEMASFFLSSSEFAFRKFVSRTQKKDIMESATFLGNAQKNTILTDIEKSLA
jgi:hypothetical protein